MRMSVVVVALAAALAAGAAMAASAPAKSGTGKMYCWVDEKGQVHYGDKVPPQYAGQDSEEINRQGIPVRRIEGIETPEEARVREELERRQKEAARAKQRDRVLLQTYQSVGEIEQLRKRRLDLLDSQIRIQQQYLAQLRRTHQQQLKLASAFAPYSKDPKAEAAPEDMIADLERAEADIRTQEDNLRKRQADRSALNAQFDRDVQRFRELKGLAPPAKATATR